MCLCKLQGTTVLKALDFLGESRHLNTLDLDEFSFLAQIATHAAWLIERSFCGGLQAWVGSERGPLTYDLRPVLTLAASHSQHFFAQVQNSNSSNCWAYLTLVTWIFMRLVNESSFYLRC